MSEIKPHPKVPSTKGKSTQTSPLSPSPLVTATLQSAFLSLLSNILAQCFKASRDAKQITFSTFNYTQLLKFTIFALISTPPNYLWQENLEIWFPSNKSNAKKADVDGGTTSTSTSKSNLIKKFLTDQTISAPLNNLLFLIYLRSWDHLMGGGKEGGFMVLVHQLFENKLLWNEFAKLHLDSLKVWPLVALISFTVVPVEKRVVFGSLVALGWNIYLGMVMG